MSETPERPDAEVTPRGGAAGAAQAGRRVRSRRPPPTGDRWGIDPAWLQIELHKRGHSQAGLARYMGLSAASIVNRMAHGRRTISAREADQIWSYLEATNSGEMGHIPGLYRRHRIERGGDVDLLGRGVPGRRERLRDAVILEEVAASCGCRPEDLAWLELRRDPMEAEFRVGDRLLIDTRIQQITRPGLYAVRLRRLRTVRRVERIYGRTVRLAGPGFETARTSDLPVLGRPVWLERRLML